MVYNPSIQSAKGLQLLDKVRSECMKLPEVTEAVDAFGHTSFRIKDKPFVMMGEHTEPVSLSIKTSPFTQEVLLQQEHYYKTPYIGQHGWVSIREVDQVEWQEIVSLIEEGYGRTAPKRLLKQLGKA